MTVVRCSGALGLFADAGCSPPGIGGAEIAQHASERIAAEVGHAVPVLYADQAHGRLTFTYGAHGALPPRPHLVGTCDALITAEPGVALLVRTADCLPVALAGNGVVAMVHAGWRGLALDVIGATVRRMSAEFGVSAAHLEAVIGVGVGPCHYPVGEEVVEALQRHRVEDNTWRRGVAVDLAAWTVGRLRALGVAGAALRVLQGCTACDRRYHSVRRDGTAAGRQWSAVLRTGPWSGSTA
jgi:YfiH family protein